MTGLLSWRIDVVEDALSSRDMAGLYPGMTRPCDGGGVTPFVGVMPCIYGGELAFDDPPRLDDISLVFPPKIVSSSSFTSADVRLSFVSAPGSGSFCVSRAEL